MEGNLGRVVSQFLESDDQTQLNYVRYGLDLLEDGVNGSLGELGSQGAEDRIFIGSVQSVITALQSILNDPSQTPTALAGLATDPANILTLITLMVSTAFAAQISSITLFGDSPTNRGLVGMILDFLAGGQNGMEDGDVEDAVQDGDMEEGDMEDEDMENGDMEEEEDTASESETEGSIDEMGESEDVMENSDMEDMEEAEDGDMEQVEGSNVGLLESLISFITGILGGNNDTDDMEGDGDEMAEDEDNMASNGDMEESEGSEEEDSGTDDEREEDTMENDAISDGGSSIGGVSVSFHPIDLAALFVQVQSAIGMNCTCADGAMTEEMITKATLRLVEEEERKKTQKFKKLNKTEKIKKKLNFKNKHKKHNKKKSS